MLNNIINVNELSKKQTMQYNQQANPVSSLREAGILKEAKLFLKLKPVAMVAMAWLAQWQDFLDFLYQHFII